MRRQAGPADSGLPRFRGSVVVAFPATHSIPALADTAGSERAHGHDFRAEFVFETVTLAHPGVVIDDLLRALLTDHVTRRLAHRDLDRVLDRPATCEAIAEYLAIWFTGSARRPEYAELVSVTVTTGSGGFGQIIPPRRPYLPGGP